jgi:hypothetical protein
MLGWMSDAAEAAGSGVPSFTTGSASSGAALQAALNAANSKVHAPKMEAIFLMGLPPTKATPSTPHASSRGSGAGRWKPPVAPHESRTSFKFDE